MLVPLKSMEVLSVTPTEPGFHPNICRHQPQCPIFFLYLLLSLWLFPHSPSIPSWFSKLVPSLHSGTSLRITSFAVPKNEQATHSQQWELQKLSPSPYLCLVFLPDLVTLGYKKACWEGGARNKRQVLLPCMEERDLEKS